LHNYYKNWAKLRQKLKYRDQIENVSMTPDIIVTCDTVTTTWHDVNLTRGKLLFFLNLKKIKKSSKNL